MILTYNYCTICLNETAKNIQALLVYTQSNWITILDINNY